MESSNASMEGQLPGAAERATGSQSLSSAGQGLKDQAIAQAHAFVDQAKTTAQDKVRATVTTGKHSTVEALSGIAQSLSTAGHQLRDQQNGASSFVEQAASRLDRAAKYLDTADADDLIKQTESWARNNPALFLGGAFLLGVLGARFLKSSRPTPVYQGSGASRATFSDREVRSAPVRGDV